MQMKYLSLALAAALATTLTACGSDSDSNYKKDTLTPVTKPDVKPGDGGDVKPGDAKPGDENKKPGDDKPEDEKKPEDENKKPETPKGSDIKNNVGDAAEFTGDALKKSSVVGQQYRRGPMADFDRPLNPTDSGNATVISWKKLENTKLTNIVDGRETVPLKKGDQALRRFTGQNGSAPNVNDTYSLQRANGRGGEFTATEITGATTVKQLHGDSDPTDYLPQDNLRGGNAFLNDAGHTFHKEGNIAKTATNEQDPERRLSNVDVTGFFADTRNNIDRNAYNNGLVKIDTSSNGKVYTITGQEDQIVKLGPDQDTVAEIDQYGQNTPTRILGHYYNHTDVNNATGQPNNLEANSWALSPNAKSIVLDPTNKAQAKSASLRQLAAANSTAGYSQIGKKSQVAVNNYDPLIAATTTTGYGTDGKGNFGLAANAIKLQHVQYGRVTANINALNKDAVRGLLGDEVKEQAFFYAPLRNKFNYNITDTLSGTPNTPVDTYFYRGLGETSLADMAKLPQDAKYDYYGHAVTYGIDNRYHGPGGFGDTNSFTYGKDKVGLGNFVTAKYDVGAKKVEGYIYNVWLPDVDKKDVTIDKLVNFKGDVAGNSIVNGTSELAYTVAPGVTKEGAFKGSFYGNKASELGGSVNSITEGYGNVEWGAVFGAQRAVTGGNANQID